MQPGGQPFMAYNAPYAATPVPGFVNVEKYPMQSYFPQELFYELWQYESNNHQASTANAPCNNAIPQHGEEPKFHVVHTTKYTPWALIPNGEQTRSSVIGQFKTLREGNERALTEVYEKYGGLAHLVMGTRPEASWIRKAVPDDYTWPNTWKLEDGCLRFEVVNSKLHYTLKAEIYVVKG